MKKIKYCILGLTLMGIGFLAGGCADSVKAEGDNSGYTFSKDGAAGNMESYTMVDNETKVNYIVIKYWDNRDAGVSVTITPRLTTGGAQYISQ